VDVCSTANGNGLRRPFSEVLEVVIRIKSRPEWFRKLGLVHRRTGWFPTWLGLFFLSALLILPVTWWWTCGESYLTQTRRLSPDVLAVEGWIGYDGIRAAAAEFKERGYQYVLTTGSEASERWDRDRSSYAEMAKHELLRSGVPTEKIIVAPATDTETQRTYDSALAGWRALQTNGIHPKTLNVFTWGPHARRSRMVFSKIAGQETKVGVVGWEPRGYRAGPWWRSSERAKELLTETAGYLYECFFDSGRSNESSGKPAAHDLAQDSGSELRTAAH
jgi:hypothetical protein